MFADDTKIYSTVSSSELDDINRLRVDMSNLVSWSKEWNMLHRKM